MPKGRRLGYMGHLIYMLDSLNLLVMVSPQFRALVESSLTEDELTCWNQLTDPTNGQLASALKIQKSYLGGIDPNASDPYDSNVSKDFQDESFTGDYYNDIDTNMYAADDNATRMFEAACSLKSPHDVCSIYILYLSRDLGLINLFGIFFCFVCRMSSTTTIYSAIVMVLVVATPTQ